MRPDLLEQRHDGLRACEHDLVLAARAAGVELGTLLLERVEGVEAEERPEDVDRFGVQLGCVRGVLERFEEVFHDEVLAVCFREAVEVNEEVVPDVFY